mmetsp:Transcript_130/g.258  ORF Transcript_130/g.258 Transcript_130/m.258 type:complete len:345 (-) Transcript_130:40-1074(-)
MKQKQLITAQNVFICTICAWFIFVSSCRQQNKYEHFEVNRRRRLVEGVPNDRPVLYLHIYKAAGSTSRRLFKEIAQVKKVRYMAAGQCRGLYRKDINCICLHNGKIKSFEQIDRVRRTQIIAGHFYYGFHKNYGEKNVPVYMTTFRNPLHLAVSGTLYAHGKKIHSMQDALSYVRKSFQSSLNAAPWKFVTLSRLCTFSVDGVKKGNDTEYFEQKVREIKTKLNEFVVVGVVKHFDQFVDLVISYFAGGLQLDLPEKNISLESQRRLSGNSTSNLLNLRDQMKGRKENPSHYSSSKVISRMMDISEDRDMLLAINESLKFEWQIYEYALHLFKVQCENTDLCTF